MQLPVDVKALINEATNIKAARETEISVSVYIDESAPVDVVAHVRNAFASSLPTVRMTLTYLTGKLVAQPVDDIAIIVAGLSERVGADAAELRAVGVPVMVVTSSPLLVGELAREGGNPIPEGDLVFASGDADSAEDVEPIEPVALNDDLSAKLDEKMGRWIVSVCREKRLAYAIAFPFVRRPLARDAVQSTALQNAGVGLISIIPGADLPIMTLNQAKMVLQIAAAYGQDMDKGRLKELAAVIGGGYLCRALARELIELVPVLGLIVRTGVAYGGTAAIGYAVIEYFEGGENMVGVANVVERAVEAGSKAITTVYGKAEELVSISDDAGSSASR